MALRMDYSKVGPGLVPPGEYEVVIQGGFFAETKNGKEYFSIPLVIRNDIPEQKYQNSKIFDGIFALHSDKAIGFKTNNISKAIAIPEGAEFEDLEDWGRHLCKKPMRVKVAHEDYEGRTQVRIQYYAETRRPDLNHIWKSREEEEQSSSPYLVEDLGDDVPF